MSLNIPRESVEKLETVITADADPTSDVVAFAFVQGATRPTTFTAGTWKGAYASGQATAVTPTIGTTGSGAGIELAAGEWKAYVKVTDSPEVPVRSCGLLTLA